VVDRSVAAIFEKESHVSDSRAQNVDQHIEQNADQHADDFEGHGMPGQNVDQHIEQHVE
jgi:hypothetical protein